MKLCLLFLSFFVLIPAVIYGWFESQRMQRPLNVKDSILITGCSSGVGYHAALATNAFGFTVFAGVRKVKDAERLKKTAIYPDKLFPLILDVTKKEQIEEAYKFVDEHVGAYGLTALFNNAGVTTTMKDTESKAVENTPIEEYEFVMNVNTLGAIRITKEFLPLLKRRGKDARIIMNSSLSGILALPFGSPYSVSKHAMEGFTDILRRELSVQYGIKVITFNIGALWTNIYDKMLNPWLDGTLPEKFNSNYAQEKAGLADIFGILENAVGAEVTSSALIDAILSNAPRTRYALAPLANKFIFLGSLPVWLQDYAFKSTAITPAWSTERLMALREMGNKLSTFDTKPFLQK